MAKAYFYIKDSTNKELQKIEVNITDFDTAPIGKLYNIELREVGLKTEYVGNYIKGSTLPLPTTPTTTVCPPNMHWDATLGKCVEDTPTPTPTGILYRSSIEGKWSNGIARFVTDREGNTGANGFGFTVNASGEGGFRIDGQGLGILEPATSGHRRIYPCVCNYNAGIRGKFAFLSSKVRNFSIKGRNRHQFGDEVGDAIYGKDKTPVNLCQGGLGIHFDLEGQSAGFQWEEYHGKNGGDFDVALPKNMEVNKYYNFDYQYFDTSSTQVKIVLKLDYMDGQGYRTLINKTVSPPSVFFNKAQFLEWSQFWLRLNDEGKIGMRDIEVYSI